MAFVFEDGIVEESRPFRLGSTAFEMSLEVFQQSHSHLLLAGGSLAHTCTITTAHARAIEKKLSRFSKMS